VPLGGLREGIDLWFDSLASTESILLRFARITGQIESHF